MSDIDYTEFRPDPRVAALVHRAWIVDAAATVDDFLVLPDACIDVLFTPGMGLQLVGTMTTAQSMTLAAGTTVVGLRLHTGAAAPWLRHDLAEFTDAQVPLRDVLGASADALEERLRAIARPRDQAALLCETVSRALAEGWARADPRERALRQAIERLRHAEQGEGEAVCVDALARQCDLGARQFQRLCSTATGLSPKQLARVLRLERLLNRRRHTDANWTTLAADGGFADQAHFIHDFAKLVGCSPGEYARRTGDVRFSQVGGDGPA